MRLIRPTSPAEAEHLCDGAETALDLLPRRLGGPWQRAARRRRLHGRGPLQQRLGLGGRRPAVADGRGETLCVLFEAVDLFERRLARRLVDGRVRLEDRVQRFLELVRAFRHAIGRGADFGVVQAARLLPLGHRQVVL